MKTIMSLLLTVCVALPAMADSRLVTTSAQGSVESVPDIAIVSGQVQVEAETAREATRQAQRQLEKVVNYILAKGVAKQDLNAATVRVHPKWHYPRNKPREIVGFQASAPFTATLRDLDKLGEVYGDLPKAGATDLGETRFDFSDREALELKAIADATLEARKRAQASVAALGNSLGEVHSIQVNTRWQQPPAPMMMRTAEASFASAAPKVNVGNHTITASVTASFTIQ